MTEREFINISNLATLKAIKCLADNLLPLPESNHPNNLRYLEFIINSNLTRINEEVKKVELES